MKKNKYTIVGIVSFILLTGGVVFYVISSTQHAYTWNDSDPMTRFVHGLPQFKNKNPDKEVCTSLQTDTTSSNVFCFTPNKIQDMLTGRDDQEIENWKNALSKSKAFDGHLVEKKDKPLFMQIYDTLLPASEVKKSTYLMVRKHMKALFESGKFSPDEGAVWGYIQSLEGNYDEAKKVAKKVCELKKSLCDDSKISISIKGKVLLSTGTGIQNALVEDLSSGTKTTTNILGEYSLDFTTLPFQQVRIKVSKVGLSNGVYPITLISEAKKQEYTKDFTLISPAQMAVIDTERKTITGVQTEFKDNEYHIRTKWSYYRIPQNVLIHRDGSAFKGIVNVYLFDFDKHSNNQDLLQNDTFDSVVGYAGNLMKTFGMPYALFVTDSGEVIHIKKSNPILLQSQIIEMKALKSGSDRIYEALTDEDMQFLLEESKKNLNTFSINRQFLIDHQLLKFPAFWMFDQVKGVWENIGVRLLSKDGLVETPYYSLNDQSF